MENLYFRFFNRLFRPYKNHITTATHQTLKNQSFFVVPFNLSHSKTTPSINKSKINKPTNPKIQSLKKTVRFHFLKITILKNIYSTVTDLAKFLG